MTTPKDILGFWLDEVGEARWYDPDTGLDDTIRERFGADWEKARLGAYDAWSCSPQKALASLILLDQFPRNMFRGDSRAFATDIRALSLAKRAISLRFPARVPAPERQFFYLPLMHSEFLPDQDRAVRRFVEDTELGDNLGHARAHRAVIRRFGRFPYRNAALGRRTTQAEQAFLDAGGYAAAMAEVGIA